MKHLIFTGLVFILGLHQLQAQEDLELETEIETEEHYHKHVISLGLGHSHINEGFDENGNNEWLVLPSWMLDYNYWFKENWAVGLHTDMIVENFRVEDHSGEAGEEPTEGTIERENPIAIVGALSYKPIKWLSLVAGGGVEYEADESFGLMRLGIEPHMEVLEKWEIFANLSYDIKFDAYNTYNLAIGIGRGF